MQNRYLELAQIWKRLSVGQQISTIWTLNKTRDKLGQDLYFFTYLETSKISKKLNSNQKPKRIHKGADVLKKSDHIQVENSLLKS